MGRDKALVAFRGRPMVQWVADALRAGGCSEVVAIGGDADALGALGIRVVADLHPGEGPLGAVLTALAVSPAAPVMVVGCDTPLLAGDVVRRLASALDEQHDAHVAMGVTDRRQPLLAVWTPSCARTLQEAFDAGERAIRRAVVGIPCAEVQVPSESVRNVNTPDDLND